MQDIKKSKLWCFDELSFLQGHTSVRKSVDNIEDFSNSSFDCTDLSAYFTPLDDDDESSANCSEKSASKRPKKNYNAVRQDFQAIKESILNKTQNAKKFSWLGNLVSTQMDEISADKQQDAAWEVQQIMQKYIAMSRAQPASSSLSQSEDARDLLKISKIKHLDSNGKHNGNAVVPKAEDLESLNSQDVDFLEFKLPNSKHGSSRSSSRTRSSSESRKPKIENDESVPKTLPPAIKAVERTLSNEEKIELIEAKTEKLKMERETVKVIREALCKKPVKVRTLDLLKLSEKDFLKTFENHREDLQNIFGEQNTHKKFRCADGVDHFLVINLVTNKIQQKLMEKLSEAFEKQINGTPKYGELFSMILMPEWILRVFMSRFKMTRAEAIDHIKAQNAYKAFNSISNDELDKMASKKK